MKHRSIKIIFILVLSLLAINIRAGVVYSMQDSLLYEEYMQALKANTNLPLGKLVVKTALYFRGTSYVASTLDNNKQEELIINLREFDCNTFVENCIALSLTIKSKDFSFSNFCNQLQSIRYREGVINDYVSRLHYVSDWGYVNGKKGYLIDKSESLGGLIETKKIDFMSIHFDAYKPLANDKILQDEIIETENQIQRRGGFYVINKSVLNKLENKIHDGDLIAFATSIPGLDYSHIGIAYHVNGRLTFIHASTRTMTVVVEPQPLYDYCQKLKKCTGISVFRLKNK